MNQAKQTVAAIKEIQAALRSIGPGSQRELLQKRLAQAMVLLIHEVESYKPWCVAQVHPGEIKVYGPFGTKEEATTKLYELCEGFVTQMENP